MVYTYGEIPDDVPNKVYYPLSKNIWRLYKKMGWDYLKPKLEVMVRDFYDVVRVRLDEAILTAKELEEGKITSPEKVFTYYFFPPVLMIRNDLQVGTTKLLYGESIDVSYVTLLDSEDQIAFVLNCHGEDGVPVDFWYCGIDDDLLDRRHQKLGIKFRNLTKLKSLTNIGLRAIDILKDIRNERTPQWGKSPYYIIVVWGLGIANAGLEISNFENIAYIHDGVNNKNWGFPEQNFTFAPFPPFLKILFNMNRVDFTKKFAGLTSAMKLFCHHTRDKAYPWDWFLEHLPECYEGLIEAWNWGVPFPKSSITAKIPNYKKEYEKGTDNFDMLYDPIDARIKLEDLGLDIDEALSGVYLDVNHETKPQKLDPSSIISTGCGRDTKIR